MTKNEVIKKLQGSPFEMVSEREIQDGVQLKLKNGDNVNVYHSGSVVAQGASQNRIKKLLGLLQSTYSQSVSSPSQTTTKKVLIAGHDYETLVVLFDKLNDWNIGVNFLHPDELLGNGATIVEKIDEHITNLSCSILVASINQFGMIDDQEALLELGLLLGKFGRNNVIILLKDNGPLNLPSNITGLRYLHFKNSIDECIHQLATELQRYGYTCP